MAREFNGSSQYISPAAELDISGTAITISAWVYIDSLTADKMIVCKGDANAYNYNYFLSLTGLGYLPDHGYVVFGYITGSVQKAAEGSTLLSVNTWYHLLGVYNGATQKIYIDAVQDASRAETGSMTQNNYAVKIGASPNIAGHSLYHDGRIAEVGIWNAALNADEIKALKNGISPAFIRSGSLVAYYPLTGQESPEPDWKAGNNGTVTGATAVEHLPITYPDALVNEWNKISASNVTVAPSPSTAAAASVNPTVVLGSLTLAPSVSTAAAASVNPTVVLGSLTLTPTPASAAAASVAPTVALSSMTVAPAAASAAAAVVAPTVVQSSMTVAPSVSAAAAASVNPTVVLGSLTLAPASASAAAASVAPTVVQSSMTVAPTARTAAAASVNPTVVLGSLALTPTPASAAAASVNPTVVLGSITVAPTARTAAAASVAPTVVLGALALTPTPASAVAASVAPTVVLGSVAVTPSPASAVAATVNPTVNAGGDLTITPSPASAAAASAAPTVVLGSITVAPAARTAAAASVAPTVVLGSLVITPAARTAAAVTVNPTVLTVSPSITPAPASASAATNVLATVVLGSVVITPAPASAVAVTLVWGVYGGEPEQPPEITPLECAPKQMEFADHASNALFARIDGIDVPVVKASVTWKLGAVAEFTVSVPARSIDRRRAHFADIALWEGGVKIISGLVADTPQLELDYGGVSQLSLRCIDEVGRLTTTRAILTKHVQDEWLPQAVRDILRVANWELNSFSTMTNISAHLTVDLRNKDSLFAQVAEAVKSVPRTLLRYAGVNPISGRHMLDIGYFNRNQYHLFQGDNLTSLKIQHNTNRLVRVLEAYSDALPDRRITLADALQYPSIATQPDYPDYPIMYDGARGNYVMINNHLSRGADVAKSFSMHRTKNDGVPSSAEIAAAGFSVWQRGVRFLQQSDDYLTATATGLFEQIPLVGDKIYVRGRAVEVVWDSALRIYREEETFSVAEWMRITQVSYSFEHAAKPGYTRGRPIHLYQCSLELTTAEYPEEFDDAQQIVESVQTFKQLDTSNSIPVAGALTYVPVAVTHLASEAADLTCGGTGKQFSFSVPSAPAGATKLTASIMSISHPSGSYTVLQAASFPSTPLIVCANVAGAWGSDNLTLTAQYVFS